MHRRLEILEIVELICAQLTTEPLQPLTPAAARDLSVLARASAIFLNPALNILWRHQDTILNILKCMPQDLWCITETEDAINIHLRRTIVAAGWDRPLLYCYRVRALDMDMHSFLDADFLETLSLCLPGEFRFPNLRKLDWYSQPSESLHHVRLFLGSGIRDLRLGGIETISTCPFFPTSRSNDHLSHILAIPIISTFVRSLVCVESLVVPGLDQSAFVHLARLPGLPSLKFHCAKIPGFFAQPFGYSADFTSLTPLDTLTMDYATALLTMLPNRPFLRFSIGGISLHCTHTARRFYSALAARCSHSSLQFLAVLHIGEDEPSTEPLNGDQIGMYSVAANILLPLSSFAHLVHGSISMTPQSSPWPALGLALNIYHFERDHFAMLSTLAMSFDATLVPKIWEPTKARTSQPTLRTLTISISLISQPGRVAVFLSAIYPKLSCIDTFYEDRLTDIDEEDIPPDVMRSHNLWMQVESALHSEF
ncbi:hypothetical protein DFH09DRAFT_1074811 [Mycena vulgaris]|nr:hypothetical protein DFH09DRAFT_1074811 [Mycena vulgaris]